ncbi:glycerate kinase [Shewanella fidelis]|uniref:Glycerate kinase n=1 Tax=Shewanella fidelis TaxID=173509 RepID=A0AAW8NK19_9GAMM|nr:glycerate kinase [Shewanella fidelis]MDR8523207.1 glycerate kinase [Shewanella fidelis]MDW4811467.1 glycerate kinase [Shewanella fidelis]MDW4815588.1 glycerate kinase [Shewanella fidelis]MDW4819678.1 glycerate kinase [Shewanella fidelis]MDW4824348.1 glycerate kinase [Shewanella fidelis]
MKIVIAPDSFKESLTAMEVANEIERGFRTALPNAEYIKVPVADGGEGTVQSMVDATQGSIIKLNVTGPLGTKVQAFYGILGAGYQGNKKTAVIEMAAASGLHLVNEESRNPLITTSYGTGELIVDALNRGIEHIIIGLGGSATNDGGAGMAQAIGAHLLDDTGKAIATGGAALAQLATIDLKDLHPLITKCSFEVACDVNNPLCGNKGASAIFGPQKGATPQMVEQLDAALGHYADIIAQTGIVDNRDYPGVGAAGGMGLGVMAFLGAQLKPGIDIVMQTVNLAECVKGADLVITGEGRLDSQTLHGKTPMGVAGVAKAEDVKVIAIAGCVSDDANVLLEHGIDALFSITPRALPLAEVLASAKHNLYCTSKNIANLYALAANR